MQPLKFRSLDLNLLRVFDEVMTERSLTRAAEKLSITQPAVSNALRRLRQTLGDELLVRQGHGVEPTPQALELWPVVREALLQLQQALAPESFEPATARNSFLLTMADATAARLIPNFYQLLEREAPGIRVRIQPLTTRDPRRLLDEQSVDMAVGYFPSVLADLTARAQSGALVAYESRRLYDGDYVAVMRRGHRLAGAPLDLDAYCAAQHLLVSFSGRAWGFIDESLASMGRERQIVLTVNQYATAARVVAQSDLITVLPAHFLPVCGMAEALQALPLPLDVSTVHVDALWHRARSQYQPGYDWLLRTLLCAAQPQHR